MFSIAWLLFALPAAGALINLLVGHLLPKQLKGYIASGAVVASFFVAVGLLINMLGLHAEDRVITVHLWNWIEIGDFHVAAAMLLDPLSITMTLIITGVGSLIHIYSTSYMEDDENFGRFFIYLNFFILSMLILVLSDNFVGMFVGWEGVGLASFLLIGFWFDRKDDSYGYYADAGKKAFLVNRIGDFGMIVAMLALWTTVGSLTFLEVFDEVHHHPEVLAGVANLVCIALLLGAAGKSAQIPLYVWLPDAMAGPTPVSALIHAATMVTAGIYMIARTHAIWHIAETASMTAAWIGAFTALIAATIAIVQVDLKKILAYSTVSQLGYMMLGVGVGAYGAAVFHLMTHAFFKALLFLAAGSVMHATHGELDIRKMGGLKDKMPMTFRTFAVGAAALAGLPLMSGFFSKDAILLGAMVNAPFLYIVGLVTALLTAFYSARSFIVPFLGEPRDHHVYDHAHESPPLMTIPLIILAFFSLIAGFFNLPFVLTFEYWLEPALGHHEVPSLVFELLAIMFSLIIGVFGVIMAFSYYRMNENWVHKLAEPLKRFEPLLHNKWYVDEIYGMFIVRPILAVSEWFARFFDKTIIDGAVNGLPQISQMSGERLRYLQTGIIPNYALSILVGVVVVVVYFMFA
ncbi:MAG: NADH-quinone oxidoreductase subunit L [Chloroflexota bacterium]